jgi:hypothetical protein
VHALCAIAALGAALVSSNDISAHARPIAHNAACLPPQCTPYPKPGHLPFLTFDWTPQYPQPGQVVTLKAVYSNLPERPVISWNLHESRADDATGPVVSTSFSAGEHRVRVRALYANGKPVLGLNNLPVAAGQSIGVVRTIVVQQVPSQCTNAKPFDLLWGSTDANGLPLNPEWNWQCAYEGDGGYVFGYPDPYYMCNQFKYGRNPPLNLAIGPNCANFGGERGITGIDVPTDFPFYTVCHTEAWYKPGLEPDTYVHGHVNWRPVTFTGAAAYNPPDALITDGDSDLKLYPGGFFARGASSGPQIYAKTVPALTPANEGANGDSFIETEFYQPEAALPFFWAFRNVANPFGYSFGPGAVLYELWHAKLEQLSGNEAVMIGLLGLDNRHDAKTELHPIYAFAIRENGATSQNDRWIVLFKNTGSEGGCSSHNPLRHPLPLTRLTVSVPSLLGASAAGVTMSGSSVFGFHVAEQGPAPIAVSLGADHRHADVTVTLPPYQSEPVLVGEITLKWSGGEGLTPSVARAPFRSVGAPHVQVPEDKPEDVLAHIYDLLPRRQRTRLASMLGLRGWLHRPKGVCKLLGPAATRARREGRDRPQAAIVKAALKCP